MKHNLTQLEGKNDPVNFSTSVLGNYFLELETGIYQVEEVGCELDMQSDLLQFSRTDDINCNIVKLITNLGNDTNQVELEYIF